MICSECARYSKNIKGCYTQNLCHADMMDEDCAEWFVKREPMHECHRPNDFEEVADE